MRRFDARPGLTPLQQNRLTAATADLVLHWQSTGEVKPFISRRYGARSHRTKLMKVQGRNCAYCEGMLRVTCFGDVEHFRPKAGFVGAMGVLVTPGYFWLAYDWDNLLLSCQICNSNKGNNFPILVEGNRARTPDASLTNEDPLLIDPFTEDPGKYIGFDEEVAYAINDNERGRRTIDILDLNSEDLVDARAAFLQRVEGLIAKIPTMLPGAAKDKRKRALALAISDRGMYQACLRASGLHLQAEQII